MNSEHVIFLSVAGLRPGDIDAKTTPTLHAWAERGALAELVPSFPCVTSPVQATMWTGKPPGEHGVIANGFYDRARDAVAFWMANNDVIAGEQVWDAIRRIRPEHHGGRRPLTSAVWHAQNIKAATADFIVTPAPIHGDDGTTKLWCYSKPEGTYQHLVDELGHFPLQHYWGPLAGIESTRWILDAAAWLIDRHAPNLHWIYIPHLDYASQKFGPDSDQAKQALVDLDGLLGVFADRVSAGPSGSQTAFLVAGEYAMTNVVGAVFPNRVLRQAGYLAVREENGAEVVDLQRSEAFAVVDHQLAHVYVRDDTHIDPCVELLSGLAGVAGVHDRHRRREIGLDHARSGDIVLTSNDDRWFAYYWWLDDAAAPAFARTVDIHRKPGYDPVELFIDPATKSIPLDATLVKGSHGVPATQPQHRTALICSTPSEFLESGKTYRDTDVLPITLGLLG